MSRSLLLLSLLGCATAHAEGTEQLGDTQAMHPNTQLFVDILHAGETITWTGQHSIEIWAPGSNVNTEPPLAVLASGSILTTAGAGLGTYTVRLGGSIQSGNIGFETDWDLSVSGAQNGRVWSRAWQLDSGSFQEEDEFNGSFYAKVDGGGPNLDAVVEFRAEGLAGFIWFVAANDFGLTGQNGRSYNWPSATNSGINVVIRYPIYLLPPENANYQTATPSVSVPEFVSDGECAGIAPGLLDGEFQFETEQDSTWHIVCDLNEDGQFDITTDDDLHLLIASQSDPRVLSAPTDTARQVRWDGLNNLGDPVDPGTYQCRVLVTVGEFHYVASDVETAYPGIRMFNVDAQGVRTGLPMFWNDGDVAHRNEPMENSEYPLDFSGPDGLFSGSSAVSATPNVNARSWGSFQEASKGNIAFLDTYTFVDSAISELFDVTVLDITTDTDEDGLSDVEETCFYGTDPTLKDTDNDGIDDDIEVHDLPTDPLVADSDNDGLLDGEEIGDVNNPQNTDNDALIDALDPDDDNNGVPTSFAIEHGDTDDDDIPDYLDDDDDNDTVPTIEEVGNTDGDDLPNYRDPDDDGDGLATIHELEFGDTDQDGTDDYLDDDDDDDGIPTADEDLNGDGDPRNDNSDGDLLPDYRDPDDDGDGISTEEEGTGDPDEDDIPAYLDEDSDGDSIPDAVEGTGDSDSDSIPDYLDDDDDGDGILTIDEVANGDSDNDTIDDYLDEDDDNDGIPTRVEGDADPDDDDTPNYLDEDSDGDGLSDEYEGQIDTDNDTISDYLDEDSDGDGQSDATEGSTDSDLDGIPNFRDTDDDGDTVPTSEETGDTDGDGVDDYLDTDDDGDGIPTETEAAWSDDDVDGDQNPNWTDLDSDGDGIPDSIEGTEDTDDDGIPDYLDPDGEYGLTYQGGCTLDHSGGAGFAWLMLLMPLFLRRRR